MKNPERYCRYLAGLLVFLLSALTTGCGQDQILGTGAVAAPPTVIAVTPVNDATGVPIGDPAVTATFSEPVVPITGGASFTLTCAAPCASATGTVALDATGRIASFTLTPATSLEPLTLYTATISGAQSLATGLALASPFVWHFTTGASPDTTPPTVTAVTPLNNATGVAINTLLTASFSEAMNPLTITAANFSLSCPDGTAITGTVGYAAIGNVATFTPNGNLPISTTCTATLTTGVKDVAGNAMANAFVWHFTTGAAPDTSAPTVISTDPVDGATGVPINTLITASFSEAMNPLTITAANFTLACPTGTPVTGTVGYAVIGGIATFTPTSALPVNTTCTATIKTGVKDVAGNALANPFVWSFTTGAAPDTTPPTEISTNPADGAVGVCINKTINATFSEPMNPLTITTATFLLSVTGGASVSGVVTYDAAARIATFVPIANLIGIPATNYTVTIKGGVGGVRDLAGNPLAVDKVTTFTTNSSTCTTAPPLGGAAPFAGFGGNATLTNDGLATVINGDIGVNAASGLITGLRDSGGNIYTVTPNNDGMVNGLIYTLTDPPGSVPGAAVAQASADALLAFNSISPGIRPGGIDMSSLAQCPSCGGVGGGADELAGRTLPPGIYLSATGTFDLGGAGRTIGSLTLDAGGDANAVWVFQTTAGTGTLNVGLTGPATPAVPIQVLLINGAQAKNVFWYVPAGATIGTGSTVAGTLLADAAITISTTGGSPPTAVITALNGRAIALTAAVTMTNTVINVPAP